MDRLWDGVAYGDDPRTRKTPKLAVNISGVNYAKPYPPADGAAGLAAPNPARNGNQAPASRQTVTAEKTSRRQRPFDGQRPCGRSCRAARAPNRTARSPCAAASGAASQ